MDLKVGLAFTRFQTRYFQVRFDMLRESLESFKKRSEKCQCTPTNARPCACCRHSGPDLSEILLRRMRKSLSFSLTWQ